MKLCFGTCRTDGVPNRAQLTIPAATGANAMSVASSAAVPSPATIKTTTSPTSGTAISPVAIIHLVAALRTKRLSHNKAVRDARFVGRAVCPPSHGWHGDRVDLNAEHVRQLRGARALRWGLPAGSAMVSAAGPHRAQGAANGLNRPEVCEWAGAQGIEVNDRGRVPAELVVKFKAATTI